jgi:hypothetical protein
MRLRQEEGNEGGHQMREEKIVSRKAIDAAIQRALKDEKFREEFMKNPKAVIEKELGFKLADKVKIKVHKETLHDVHIVLPATLPKSDVEGQEAWGDFADPPAVLGVRG